MRQHTLMRLVLLAIILWLLHAAAFAAPVGLATIRQHLVQWEGYRLTPYKDGPNGYSVGIGHSLFANGERVKPRYTAIEVERLLLRDIAWSLDSCRTGIDRFDDLPERVQLVAIGVAFTTGRTGFIRFSGFRRALSWRAFDMAASELGRSRWYTQVSARRANAYIRTLRTQL